MSRTLVVHTTPFLERAGTLTTPTRAQAIQEQLDRLSGLNPSDVPAWHLASLAILRVAFGTDSPLYLSLQELTYRPEALTPTTRQSAVDAARETSIRRAEGIMRAALLEISLLEPLSTASPVRDIFIIHGRDNSRKYEVARLVSSVTKSDAVILHEQTNAGRTILEKLIDSAESAAYAVILATADDLGRLRGDPNERPRARQNVVFEAGYFFGRLGRSRVAFLHDAGIEIPSDLDGLVRIQLDEAGAWKLALVRELNNAGIEVDFALLK